MSDDPRFPANLISGSPILTAVRALRNRPGQRKDSPARLRRGGGKPVDGPVQRAAVQRGCLVLGRTRSRRSSRRGQLKAGKGSGARKSVCFWVLFFPIIDIPWAGGPAVLGANRRLAGQFTAAGGRLQGGWAQQRRAGQFSACGGRLQGRWRPRPSILLQAAVLLRHSWSRRGSESLRRLTAPPGLE